MSSFLSLFLDIVHQFWFAINKKNAFNLVNYVVRFVNHYSSSGYYQGQWQDGKRNGYGVRTSAPFGLASHYRSKNVHSSMSSLRSNENEGADKHRGEDVRGGFVLKARSDEPPLRRNSLGEKSKKGFLSVILKVRILRKFLRAWWMNILENPKTKKHRWPREARDRSVREYSINSFHSIMDKYRVFAIWNHNKVRIAKHINQ